MMALREADVFAQTELRGSCKDGALHAVQSQLQGFA